MIKKLLIPIDDSLFTVSFISESLDLAEQLSCSVVFLHINSNQNSLYGDAEFIHVQDPQKYDDMYLLSGIALLMKAEGAAKVKDIKVDSIISNKLGSITKQVNEEATDNDVDLIVVAGHHKSSLLTKLMKSVSLKVIINSPISCLRLVPGLEVDTKQGQVVSRVMGNQWMFVALLYALQNYYTNYADKRADEKHDEELLSKAPALLLELLKVQGLFDSMLYNVLQGANIKHLKEKLTKQQVFEASVISIFKRPLALGEAKVNIDNVVNNINNGIQLIKGHIQITQNELLPISQKTLSEADWERFESSMFNNKVGFVQEKIEHEYKVLINYLSD